MKENEVDWKDGLGDLLVMPTSDLLRLKGICEIACDEGLDLIEASSSYIPKYRFIALEEVEKEIQRRMKENE